MLNPAAMPYWANRGRAATPKASPTSAMDDILLKHCPLVAPPLPNNRPKRLSVFIDRDADIAGEIAKLGNGVVFDTHGHELGFKLDDVAGFATRTKTVSATEISIGMLAPGRFLITLPIGMAPETFINATGPELWDAGFTFQPWSPLDGAKVVVPEYKALLTLHGLPPFLRKEPIIAKAVSTFGTFLGTVPQQGTLDLSLWTVVVAIDRLERIPEELEVNEKGLEFILSMQTKNWMRAPLYSAAELPQPLQKFSKPPRSIHQNSSGDSEEIPISRRVLMDLCKNIDYESLSEEVKALLAAPTNRMSLSLAQTELLVNLKPTPTEEPKSARGEQENMQDGFRGKGTTEDPVPEAGHDLGSIEGNTRETGSHSSHQIKEPVQILQRSLPRNLDPAQNLIPRTILPNVPQGQYRTGDRGQLTYQDKGEASKTRQRIGGNKDKGIIGSKAQTRPKKGKAMQQPKMGRVVNLQIPPRPASFKQNAGRARQQNKLKEGAQRAEVTFTSDGFYEVSVQYDHCEKISKGCGLNISDVQMVLNDDNIQRQAQATKEPSTEEPSQPEEGPCLEFDSEEEDGSEPDLD